MKKIPTFEEFLNESYTGPIGVTLNNIKFSGFDKTVSVKLNNRKFRLRMELQWPNTSSKQDIDAFENLNRELKRLKFPTKVEYTKNIEFGKQHLILNGYYDVYDVKPGIHTLIQIVGTNTLEFNVYSGIIKRGKIVYSDVQEW